MGNFGIRVLAQRDTELMSLIVASVAPAGNSRLMTQNPSRRGSDRRRRAGLNSPTPSWATPFDLFRCSGGSRSFSYSAAAYFSIDGCKTNLGNFNNVGGGDRSDWASGPAGIDVQNAYLYPGHANGLSAADLIALDVIRWGGTNTNLGSLAPSSLVVIGLNSDPVPEPSSLLLVVSGLTGMAGITWRRGRRSRDR